jgi:hypothetical protein
LAKSVTARDARMLAEARKAITRLVALGPEGATGRELLGESFISGRWGRSFMRRLVDLDLALTRESPPNGLFGRRAHIFEGRPALQEYLADDQKLAAVLWPGTSYRDAAAATADQQEEEEHVPATASDDEPQQVEATQDDIASMLENVPEEALLATAVKLCAMTLQNIVYMRERVDALTKEVADLKKAWE